MKAVSTIILVATGVMSAAVHPESITKRATAAALGLSDSVINSAAYNAFLNSDVRLASEPEIIARDNEPSNSRPEAHPGVIFVLQCTEPGFRGDCLVFGSAPGQCVSYYDYQPANSTVISKRFDNKVTSLSTNTDGKCQFFKYKGCNNKGDDRGLASSYNYDLTVPLQSDPRTVEYNDQITSWKC